MAMPEWNLSDQVDLTADAADPLADQTSDLKALLYTIVDQLSDADRRHSDTMQQMQDRLAAMSREASSMRSRVPEAFGPAFERIECGMSELAERIADTCRGRGDGAVNDAFSVVAHVGPAAVGQPAAPTAAVADLGLNVSDAVAQDMPLALRSAGGQALPRNRGASVDTFDVIESPPPSESPQSWDRETVDALSDFYEKPAADTPAACAPSVADAEVPTADHAWLEARFADIAKRIEDSLADIRPDQAFFALGQRLETVEHSVARVADSVATHADVEGIRQIEAHISEFATHLDAANAQLTRLDAIEHHLSDISGRLAEVHQVAIASESPPQSEAAPAMDEAGLLAVARAAVEEAKQSFAPAQLSDGEDVRHLIQRMMAESRVGEENTIALLDTLQQAMIRLLDRVDSMELAQQQVIAGQAALSSQRPHASVSEPSREAPPSDGEARASKPYVTSPRVAPTPKEALDKAVAAVASAASAAGSDKEPADIGPQAFAFEAATAESRSPERIRQDYIAEARRAKMRLAGDAAEGADARSSAEAATAAETGRAIAARSKSGPKSGTPAARDAARPTSAPRLLVMALAALTALGGLWYALDGGANAPFANSKQSAKPLASQLGDGSGSTSQTNSASDGDGAAGSDGRTGRRSDISTGEVIVGQTSVPLMGVTVDTDASVTKAEFETAQRRQQMAAVSTHLGSAAASQSAAMPTPAALVPEESSKGFGGKAESALLKSGMTTASPMDMPPASVGPLSLRLAAANGDPSAEFDVGARLAEGKGHSPNFKDAAKWYQRAADKGFAQAQYRLGTLYERGLGLKVDPARAMEWYEKAATAGNIKAMHNLAVMSANQNGASPDYASASRWFTEAAERGLADSQFNLAVLFENGLGVEQDMRQAYKWLAIASREGDGEAVRRRDILKGKLTQVDVDAAEAMIKSWRAKQADALINDARTASEAWKKNPQNGVSG
ncbi:MAG: tetratricopeptide repeat protein [Hyphomicrobium sp.]